MSSRAERADDQCNSVARMRFYSKNKLEDSFQPVKANHQERMLDALSLDGYIQQMLETAPINISVNMKEEVDMCAADPDSINENELYVAPSSSLTWHAHPQGFESTTLDNGLQVVVYRTNVQPVVQTQIMYNFGSNSEVDSKERGLAHICEHMIFKGTTKHKANLSLSETDIPAIARLLGAKYNAFTTTNCTSYHFQSCPEFTEGFLEVLSASMFDTRLNEDHLRSEKLAVLAEMSHGKDSIFRDALIKMRKKLYEPSNPQYYPTIGNIKDIADLDSSTLQDFYNRLYKPSNATLFIVGDLSEGQVHTLKTQTISTLFEKEPVATKEAREFESDPSGDEIDKQQTFHTLAKGSGFMLVSFKVKGMESNSQSLWAFKALDTLLCDGEKSRLHCALIADASTAKFGVQSVGSFAELNKDVGEYHVVIQGTDAIKEHAKNIEDMIQHVLRMPLRKSEMERCTNTVKFQTSTNNIDVESTVMSWIGDFKLSGNLDNYWDKSDDWKQALVERKDELLHPDTPHESLVYTACSPEECQMEQQTMTKERLKYRALLSSEEHKRRTPLESPNEFKNFMERYQFTKCMSPHQPFVSNEGYWTHVSSPQYQLVKIGIAPRQLFKMVKQGDHVAMGLLSDVMSEAFPQEKFKQLGLRGAFSPTMAVAASYSASKSEAFREWVDTYACQISQKQQEKLIQLYSVREDFLKKKWTSENNERRMNPEAHVSEYLGQQCSDNYFVQLNGFKDTFDMHETAVNTFDIGHAIDVWNKYWGDTTQLVMQREPAACDFEEAERSKIEYNEPRAWDTAHQCFQRLDPSTDMKAKLVGDGECHFIQVNPDRELNQSIVTIARRGSTNKSSLEYWTVQSVTQAILFHSLGSRLFKLREEKGLFYSAYGAYSVDASSKCNGYDMIQARVDPGKELEMVDCLRKWIKDQYSNPITENELIAAKRIVINKWRSMNTETNMTSNWAAHSNYFTQFVEAPHTMMDAIEQLTVEDTNAFMQKKSAGGEYCVSVVCK